MLYNGRSEGCDSSGRSGRWDLMVDLMYVISVVCMKDVI